MFPKLLALSLMLAVGTTAAMATSKAKETGLAVISTVETGYVATVGDETLTVPPAITVDFNNEDYKYMPLYKYRRKMWRQFRFTNRALRNRCRETIHGIENFTKYPLSLVHPWRRDNRVVRARNKHHRAHEKSSLCKPWPAWWERGALCIHSYEGAWNDPNAPYWGGMQMDMDFQKAYGPEFLRAKGTADRWTPYEQLLASWRAYSSGRGWGPWPLTRTYCGL